MKYVKLIVEIHGLKMILPVIFPNVLVHSIAAEAFIEVAKTHFPKADSIKVESAGDIAIGSVKTGGKSDTLEKIALPWDPADILFCDVNQFR